VGVLVGRCEGLLLTNLEGRSEGFLDGRLEGFRLTYFDGRRDGFLVGRLVGLGNDGLLLGFRGVGLDVRLAVGFQLGRRERALEGLRLGRGDGLFVGFFVGFLLGIFVGLTSVGFDDGFIVGLVDPQYPMVLYSVFDMI